jgi:hypothetical protein
MVMKNGLNIEDLARIVFERDECRFTSPEYKRGVVDGIEFALAVQSGCLPCPYDADTAEGDAWKHGSWNGIVIVLEMIDLPDEKLDQVRIGLWN